MTVTTVTIPATALRRRVELAVTGVRLEAPVARTGGAGPSDDGHVRVDGAAAALPIDRRSPYAVRDGRLLLDSHDGAVTDLGIVIEPVSRPAFYSLTTADGVPYEHIARLHGTDVLATTVVQTCMRYEEATRCRFCAIEESLRTGTTVAVKRPSDLAEVAAAAHRLDGVRQVVMTTGTSTGRDRGAAHLARCVRAVKEAVAGLAVQVQCEPPDDLAALALLRTAGADSIGIHVESLDDSVRRRWTPGKASVPLARYWEAWREAVRLFGRNQVSTYLLVGLGEDPDELVAGALDLADAGVYPFVVPFRPLAGTLAVDADGVGAPPVELVADVTARVGAGLAARGMRGDAQRAGCAACGACSALRIAGG